MFNNIDMDLVKSIVEIAVIVLSAVVGGGILVKLKQKNKASQKNSGNISIGDNANNVKINQKNSHNINQTNKSKKDGE
ncbi:hypothetical protein [Fusibacter tunisiensis]|uniref:Uncharacterized protein n=1 Tax=Fusibacter tunisiensis TaxID=1008308 RepID=A0ABS2MUF7_9FIRM|nr:hypothetical protein [Fusibacter tunisiensis]MBM7563010.1 hypothetical protein [Fusibacter tunisiensis]